MASAAELGKGQSIIRIHPQQIPQTVFFGLLDDMRAFTPNQVECFFDLAKERDAKAGTFTRRFVGDLAHESRARDATEQPLREPKPVALPTVKAVPLGMETEVDVVPTDAFESLTYDFDNFNPMQSDALRYVSGDNNLTRSRHRPQVVKRL